MRTLPKTPMKALLVAACALASSAAFAVDEFDAYFADIAILQLKPIQTELKVTEAQRAGMNKHADWLKTQGASIDSQVKSNKMTPESANKLMATHLATLKRKIVGELTAVQLKRLREITLQRDGLLPLLDLKMADKIGMTKIQVQKLREAYMDNDKKAKEIQQKAFAPIFEKYDKMKPKSEAEKKTLTEQANKELDAAKDKIQPQLTALGKSFADLVETTLTKGQKESFNNLKGKPFKIE